MGPCSPHSWPLCLILLPCLQDGFEQLNKLGEGLKSRIQIRFIDQHGMEEAGIDGGGLFKEFMECLVKEGFDPNAALFKPTSDNRLYPNPAAPGLVPNALAFFEFLGRMLGKAMYEVRPSNPLVPECCLCMRDTAAILMVVSDCMSVCCYVFWCSMFCDAVLIIAMRLTSTAFGDCHKGQLESLHGLSLPDTSG